MGFQNPLNAGQTLILGSLHSPNYIAGVSGWTINKDGTAQFNSVTIIGNSLVINNTGDDGRLRIISSAGGSGPVIAMRPPATGGHTYSESSLSTSSDSTNGNATVLLSVGGRNDDSGLSPSLSMTKNFGDGGSVSLSATNTIISGSVEIVGGITDDWNPYFAQTALASVSSTGPETNIVTISGFPAKAGHVYRCELHGHVKTSAVGCIPRFVLRNSSGTERGFYQGPSIAVVNNDVAFDVITYIANIDAIDHTINMSWKLSTNGTAGTATIDVGTYNPLPPCYAVIYDVGNTASSYVWANTNWT